MINFDHHMRKIHFNWKDFTVPLPLAELWYHHNECYIIQVHGLSMLRVPNQNSYLSLCSIYKFRVNSIDHALSSACLAFRRGITRTKTYLHYVLIYMFGLNSTDHALRSACLALRRRTTPLSHRDPVLDIITITFS